MINTKIMPQVEGVVAINDSLYCKSQDALDRLLAHISEEYDFKMREEDGNSYYARIKPEVFSTAYKCDFCSAYNTHGGSKCHGYKCQSCDKVLYKEYVHRAPVRISFKSENDFLQRSNLNFIIHSYDDEKQCLLVYAKVIENGYYASVNGDAAKNLLEKHKDCYEVVEVPGKSYKLYSFFYPSKGIDRQCDMVKINIHSVGNPPYKKEAKEGGGFNYVCDESFRTRYENVHLYKGVENNSPVAESFYIYSAFNYVDEPCDHSDILKVAGLVSDCSFYGQSYYVVADYALERMALYVENFTRISGEKFLDFIKNAPRSPVAFIVSLAKFVEEETGRPQWVKNPPKQTKPHFLVALARMFDNDGITFEEVSVLEDSLSDLQNEIGYSEKH